ncbi:SDR family oxidoreductase [bacterium]|nr:SDR family oxidoreductase [candidate division CSSED10-310 bacterium]
MRRVLITGGSGWIGSTLHEAFNDFECLVTYHTHELPNGSGRRLDLCDHQEIDRLLDVFHPEVILHCAALTSAGQCERQPDLAWSVNAAATGVLAESAKRLGAVLIYMSTDLVFDGAGTMWTERDAPRPISLYGRTKLAGEEAVRNAGGVHVILRLALCYGRGRYRSQGFTEYMIGQLASGQPVTVFTDQYRTPLFSRDIPGVVRSLLERGARGTFHVAGDERLSRHEFALALCDVFELDRHLLRPVSFKTLPGAASRPADCSLHNGALRALGCEFTSLRQGLSMLRREFEHDDPLR